MLTRDTVVLPENLSELQRRVVKKALRFMSGIVRFDVFENLNVNI